MATKRRRLDDEAVIARQVAEQLGGLPLALNQMSTVIDARNCSIADFHATYNKYEQRLHEQKKAAGKVRAISMALTRSGKSPSQKSRTGSRCMF
ncbi:hypothetical protein F5Y07DRAFT_383613 [Xylaria sp. FL0933]|nr:hypothetical protein F5Y07DRAFT_383613 [Xylaria sp. FL0933]